MESAPRYGLEYRRWLAVNGDAAYVPPAPSLKDKPSAPAPIEPATPEDAQAHRRTYASPRQKLADIAYMGIMKWCLKEPLLLNGIRMRPAGARSWEGEAVLVRNPISLPDESISAYQFAAEWALLFAECMAWASLQIEPDKRAELDPDDAAYVREITGNFPSQIVARFCNDMLSGKGAKARALEVEKLARKREQAKWRGKNCR